MDFTTSIQKWFRQNHRSMPWRETNDPYLIWLSEVILQQTRVEQGMPYYLRFAHKFPNVQALARAKEDEVLNLWQGLGYYSRARNLHAAAKEIVSRFHGTFPTGYADIRSLKGVGDYTAAAIASFAFNLPHAVVDGNVFRVISRLYKIDLPQDSAAGKNLVSQIAHELLSPKSPGLHNQAMMELGSLVCTPSKPKCESCPVAHFCLAFEDKSLLNYPVKKKKIKIRERYFNYLVITDEKNVLIKKRSAGDVWEGLYDFKLIETPQALTSLSAKDLPSDVLKITHDGSFMHILSHQKILADFWLVNVKKIQAQKNERKIALNDLEDYPMPQLLIRYLKKAKLASG
ncbi:MAG: A/G-specific adenine glycosylase [Crocinitomicaceae bacterium]|nr:A/G-specific adenine glycosylase [Crocinitomicaceae bacterium]